VGGCVVGGFVVVFVDVGAVGAVLLGDGVLDGVGLAAGVGLGVSVGTAAA